MHYYGMKKNQLASSSVKEALVSQKINLIQFPVQKYKHPTVYTHTVCTDCRAAKEFFCSIQRHP